MKRYAELTKEQKAVAAGKALANLLRAIAEGHFRFTDDSLQAAIDKVLIKADRMNTLGLVRKYIMKAKYMPIDAHVTTDDGQWWVREHIERVAERNAEAAFYPEPGDEIIFGVA